MGALPLFFEEWECLRRPLDRIDQSVADDDAPDDDPTELRVERISLVVVFDLMKRRIALVDLRESIGSPKFEIVAPTDLAPGQVRDPERFDEILHPGAY